MNNNSTRTNPCRGAGVKIARRRAPGLHQSRCEECGRVVPLNYDGRLRWHRAEVKRGS